MYVLNLELFFSLFICFFISLFYMLQLILQFIVLFSWQSIKYCVCTHGKEWRGREWGACSAFFWSGLRVFRAGSGRLLVVCHPFWNCIFLNSVKHKTLLIRSTTVHNAYSETSLLTFAKGRRPGGRPPMCRRASCLGMACMKIEHMEERFFCFSIYDGEKKVISIQILEQVLLENAVL